MLPANVTETLLDTGKLVLTTTRPMSADELAYFERAARERMEYAAAERARQERNDAALWDWLGDRAVALASVEYAGPYNLAARFIGKTAEAVARRAAALAADQEGRLPRISPVEPWHRGFACTVTYRESF